MFGLFCLFDFSRRQSYPETFPVASMYEQKRSSCLIWVMVHRTYRTAFPFLKHILNLCWEKEYDVRTNNSVNRLTKIEPRMKPTEPL